MKKKLLVMIGIIFLFISISTVISYGAISASSKTVNSGDNVTISVSSAESLGSYTITVTDNGGLTFVSSTPISGAVANNNVISGAFTTGVTNLGSFTFKAPTVTTDTTYSVKITSTATEGPNGENIAGSTATATVTVKAPVQETTPTPAPTTTSTPTTPTPTPAPELTFTSVNETVYVTDDNVRFRSDYKVAEGSLLSKGTEVKRIGTSTTMSDNLYWSKVTYNGKTGYIASKFLTTTKPEIPTPTPTPATTPTPTATPSPEGKSNDSTLKSLAITGVELTPSYNSNITAYTASVGKDVAEVEVVAQVNNEKAKYEIVGNKNLQDGLNKIIVTVTAEDGTVTNYEINLYKGTQVIPVALTINGIKENDEKVKLTLGTANIISESIIEYSIKLSEYMKAVEMTSDSTETIVYTGIGKFDLKEGNNEYTIIATITNEGEPEKTVEYRIKINNPEKKVAPVENTKKDVNFVRILILLAVAVLAVGIIVVIIVRYKRQNKVEYGKPDYSFLSDDKEENKEEKPTIDDFYNSYDSNDDGEPRRRGGKHF